MLLLTILLFTCKQLISDDILVLGQEMGPDVSGLNDRDAMMVNLLYAAAVEANQAKSSSPQQSPLSNFDMIPHPGRLTHQVQPLLSTVGLTQQAVPSLTTARLTQPVQSSLTVPTLTADRLAKQSKPSLVAPPVVTAGRMTQQQQATSVPPSLISNKPKQHSNPISFQSAQTSRVGISKLKPSTTTVIRRVHTPAPATTRRVTYIEKTPGISHSAVQQTGSSVSTMFYPVYSRNVQSVSSATWNPRTVQQVQIRKVRPMSSFVNIPAPPSLPSYRQQRGRVSENSRIVSGLMSASDLPTPPPLPFQLDGDPSLFPTPPPAAFQNEVTTRMAKLPPRNPFEQIVAKSPLWK
ncbi:Protein STU1 [Trichinella pseudospiralis]